MKKIELGQTISIFANIGIIAGIVFLGFEIRQNNKLAQASAYQEIGVASALAWDSQAHDRQFLLLQAKAASEMDATDWLQWFNKFTVFARLGETILLQVEQGLLPNNAMERLGFSGWGDIFDPDAPNYGGPKIACVWPLMRPSVSDSFRRFVEEGRDTNAIDCESYAIPTSPF